MPLVGGNSLHVTYRWNENVDYLTALYVINIRFTFIATWVVVEWKNHSCHLPILVCIGKGKVIDKSYYYKEKENERL